MLKTLTISRRETEAFFVSPIFWVLATALMAFFGLVFGLYVGQGSPMNPPQAEMRPLLSLLGTVLLFVTPLLAMRLLSEELRSGTLEVLMTSPVREWQVVVGKWLAALLVLCIMIAMTFFYVAIMSRLATKGMAPGPLATSYLGILLLGAALLAIGTMTSALTENQVVAGFLGIMIVMVLWFLPMIGSVLGTESSLGTVLSYIGLSDHYMNFGQGVIDSRDVIYFLTLTIGALYIGTRALDSRRWR
jgi:ABC-2 type transport system permease protein